MAQILVRNLEESVKRGLRARAKFNKRSLEAEAREILRAAANVRSDDRPPQFGSATWFWERCGHRLEDAGEVEFEELRGKDWGMQIPDFK